MSPIEKFLKQYSYKFPKGYPDMKNEQDILLMEQILKELNININEAGSSEIYNKIIEKKLGSFPTPKGDYKLGVNVNLQGEDAKIFKELYPISPPKSGQEDSEVGSKGSGNGEIAMYWLLSKNYTVVDGRGGGKPDLYVNNIGVEVKAYSTKKITLGRFSSDTNNLVLLNTLFGLNSLVSSLEKNDTKSKKSNPLNFTKSDIVEAFESLRDFSSNSELRELSPKYQLIKNIFDKVDELIGKLNLSSDFSVDEAAANMVKSIISSKIKEKPGDGGYIVNVTENGDIKYIQVTQDKLIKADPDVILNNSAINQGAIIINPDAIF
jgi:hypothetical protein